jgi:hypothetical protein
MRSGVDDLTGALLGRVEMAYDEVTRISGLRVPYVYGGGHDVGFLADPGYDCSSFVSRPLHVAGLLGKPRALQPDVTQTFETWGDPGKGRWMTVWDIDDAAQHHCFFEFTLGGSRPLRFAQAANEQFIVGWFATRAGATRRGPAWIIDSAGFHPRHWPGT